MTWYLPVRHNRKVLNAITKSHINLRIENPRWNILHQGNVRDSQMPTFGNLNGIAFVICQQVDLMSTGGQNMQHLQCRDGSPAILKEGLWCKNKEFHRKQDSKLQLSKQLGNRTWPSVQRPLRNLRHTAK